MSAPAKKPAAKPKPSFVSAAQTQSRAATDSAAQPAPSTSTAPPPMQRAMTSGSAASGSGSARSTPGVPDGGLIPPRLKFKPKVPVKRAKP